MTQDPSRDDSDEPGAPPVPPAMWWQDRRVAIAAGAVVVLLAIFGTWQTVRIGIAEDRRAFLEAQAAEGFLQPASTARTARVSLRAPQRVSLGGSSAAERLEFLIDARGNRFNVFRVAIARDDGVAILHFDRLQRDSNGDLRFALNSTLLPPGSYTIRIDGFTWRGATEPLGRIPLVVPVR